MTDNTGASLWHFSTHSRTGGYTISGIPYLLEVVFAASEDPEETDMPGEVQRALKDEHVIAHSSRVVKSHDLTFPITTNSIRNPKRSESQGRWAQYESWTLVQR